MAAIIAIVKIENSVCCTTLLVLVLMQQSENHLGTWSGIVEQERQIEIQKDSCLSSQLII